MVAFLIVMLIAVALMLPALLQERRASRPAAPSPDYVRRWSDARVASEARDKARFMAAFGQD